MVLTEVGSIQLLFAGRVGLSMRVVFPPIPTVRHTDAQAPSLAAPAPAVQGCPTSSANTVAAPPEDCVIAVLISMATLLTRIGSVDEKKELLNICAY